MRLPSLGLQRVTVTVEGLGEVHAYPFGAGTVARLQSSGDQLGPMIDALRVSLRDYEDVDAWLDAAPPEVVGELLAAIAKGANPVEIAEKNSPPTAG